MYHAYRMHNYRLISLAFCALLVSCAGKRPDDRWVDEIKVKGSKAIDDGDILDGLATQRSPWYWWTPFGHRKAYDPAALDHDIKRVLGFYAANGFFEAKVVGRLVAPLAVRSGVLSSTRATVAREPFSKVQRKVEAVSITLTVDEGEPTKVSKVSLRGLDGVNAELRRSIEEELPVEVGQRFDAEHYNKAKRRVPRALKAAGYPYAETEGEVGVSRGKHSAEVTLTTKPGPRARFGKTTIVGNGPIPLGKLRRLIAWKPGERYDPLKIDRTRERLFALRVFASMNLNIPSKPTPVTPVEIKLSPGKLRELRLGGGIGIAQQRHELRLLARWTWRNFLGGLRVLTAEVRPAFVSIPALWDSERYGPAIESTLKLVQPDFYHTGVTLFSEVGYDVGVEAGYREHGPKLRLGAERFFLDELVRTGVSWDLHFYDFFDIVKEAFDPAKTPLGLGFTDPYRITFFEEFVQLDLRDQSVDPRAGFYTIVRFEQGVRTGGEFRYLKVTPEARGYLPLGTRRLVLATRALFGYLRPATGENSPMRRRYFLGGPVSHRGFGFKRLAPHAEDVAVPLGGNTALLLSADLRLRLFRLAGSWLNIVGFFDAGDVVPKPDNLSFSRLHLAVGGSLVYQTPIGAIRIALGVRLNRLQADSLPGGGVNPDPGERIAFHLTLGEAF